MVPPTKVYCYVDETGQDTKGKFFLVSVVIVERDPAPCIACLEKIEETTGKGKVKWSSANRETRLAYIEAVLNKPILKSTINFAVFHNTIDYTKSLIQTVSCAVSQKERGDYKVVVYVDGLTKAQRNKFSVGLRRKGIRTRKVQGIGDETNACVRLADANCGFVRTALEGNRTLARLVEKAKQDGYIKELKP